MTAAGAILKKRGTTNNILMKSIFGMTMIKTYKRAVVRRPSSVVVRRRRPPVVVVL